MKVEVDDRYLFWWWILEKERSKAISSTQSIADPYFRKQKFDISTIKITESNSTKIFEMFSTITTTTTILFITYLYLNEAYTFFNMPILLELTVVEFKKWEHLMSKRNMNLKLLVLMAIIEKIVFISLFINFRKLIIANVMFQNFLTLNLRDMYQ
jgi:hypothetical protein